MIVKNPSWSAADVPDLDGLTIAVTGATSGIGLDAARIFAANGADTVLAARNAAKAADAVGLIRNETPDAVVRSMMLDVADLASVRAFAADFGRLDVLVNNAGIMRVPYGRTVDGFERHLGTNHLGHFALTGLLLDRLVESQAARVVTVASIAHHGADLDFSNLQYDDGRGYEPMAAYRRSKLANLLFAYELDRRFRVAGHAAISLAVHPGVSKTNLFDHFENRWWWKLARPALGLVFQSSAEGAAPTMRAATDPAVMGGQYYGPRRRREWAGPPELTTSSPLSHDREVAAQLWQMSEELTGVSYL